MTKGRPPIFETPKDMLSAWEKYVKESKESGEPITRLGFAVSVGFHRGLYSEYNKKSAFTDVLAHIDSHAEILLTNKALKGEYNSNIAKLILSAKHSVNERTERKSEVNVNVKDLRNQIIDDIEKKLEE